jgi:hypothetical protein
MFAGKSSACANSIAPCRPNCTQTIDFGWRGISIAALAGQRARSWISVGMVQHCGVFPRIVANSFIAFSNASETPHKGMKNLEIK